MESLFLIRVLAKVEKGDLRRGLWYDNLEKTGQLLHFYRHLTSFHCILFLFKHIFNAHTYIPQLLKKKKGPEILVTPHVVFICEKWTSCLWLNCLIACYQSSAAFKIYRIHRLLCHISWKGGGWEEKGGGESLSWGIIFPMQPHSHYIWLCW